MLDRLAPGAKENRVDRGREQFPLLGDAELRPRLNKASRSKFGNGGEGRLSVQARQLGLSLVYGLLASLDASAVAIRPENRDQLAVAVGDKLSLRCFDGPQGVPNVVRGSHSLGEWSLRPKRFEEA